MSGFGGKLPTRRRGRFAMVVVTLSLLTGACSATGTTTAKHPTPATAPRTTTGTTGDTGTGNTGTGGTGTTSTPTTTAAATTGGTGTTLPGTVITPGGKIRHRSGPAISKFSPVSSPVGGTVVIVGRRFGRAAQVTFDGIPAAISSNGSTRIRAVVPPGATSGPITVVTPYGSATVSGFVVN